VELEEHLPQPGGQVSITKNASKSLGIELSKQLATTQAGIKIQSLSLFTVSTVLDTNYRKTHVLPRTFDNAFFPPKNKIHTEKRTLRANEGYDYRMSEAGENSDEEYYAEESFEEDSQSEVEEQEEEEVEEVEDEEDENVELNKPNQNEALLLDESDTQSESDAEAEFIRGNVSPPAPVLELTISQFSLNPQPAPRPQPHARRQMAGRSSGGFNRDRMVSYPSSSSEDESQVVITKTVAEVNQLSLRLDTPLEDDAPSVRTLVPGSAHSRTKDEVVDDDEDAEVEEVEEVEEEEEIQSGDDDAQSDGTMESNDGRQSGEETDEDEGTDVEVEQLEEDEPIVTACSGFY